jgi:hypothetical protein
MEVHVTDDQIGRYFRRIQLGLRFLAHGARAQTTSQWSGLTPDQLVTLRRRWMFNGAERLKGPSPSSFQHFFRSARSREQAALFACIFRVVWTAPRKSGTDVAKLIASLENGELLCEAFEIYREWEPGADLEFEQAVLLATGAIDGDQIEITHCLHCSSPVLMDRLSTAAASCPRCRKIVSRPS